MRIRPLGEPRLSSSSFSFSFSTRPKNPGCGPRSGDVFSVARLSASGGVAGCRGRARGLRRQTWWWWWRCEILSGTHHGGGDGGKKKTAAGGLSLNAVGRWNSRWPRLPPVAVSRAMFDRLCYSSRPLGSHRTSGAHIVNLAVICHPLVAVSGQGGGCWVGVGSP
ncbi:hypothetical protein GW17_00001613 [Ensete ventricosum]|nr:hypothetical protein GW17_00001613 [Ensete ventricosum]